MKTTLNVIRAEFTLDAAPEQKKTDAPEQNIK